MTYQELIAYATQKVEVPELPRESFARVVVGGMGGSALPAYAARFLAPELPFHVHQDYGLPEDATGDALYVAISYSGNTEEVLSFAKEAHAKNFTLIIITAGGELAQFANEKGVPMITVPGGVPPRNILLYLTRALLLATNRTELENQFGKISFDEVVAENQARVLAEALDAGLPIFYASRKNGFLPRLAKVFWNESAKVPAFANTFPELNHNEMQAFDRTAPQEVVSLARFVLLEDEKDDVRIRRRMEVFTDLMQERGRSVTKLPLAGDSRASMLAYAQYVFGRAAELSATSRGVVVDAVPLIEEFKKHL